MTGPLTRYEHWFDRLSRAGGGAFQPTEFQAAEQAQAQDEAFRRQADIRAAVAQLGGGVLALPGAMAASAKAASIKSKHVGATAAGELAAQKVLWGSRGMAPAIATKIFG